MINQVTLTLIKSMIMIEVRITDIENSYDRSMIDNDNDTNHYNNDKI